MKSIILILFVFLYFSVMELYAFELDIYTENLPPFNYLDEQSQEAAGFSVDIVRELLRRTGYKAKKNKIKVYPWARAYRISQNEKNVMLFTMTKTETREKLFKWVGPIAPRTVWLWKMNKRKDIVVKRAEDAKKYVIGGVNEFAISKYLNGQGYNVYMVPSIKQNWLKLFANRIDLGTALEIEAAYYMKKYGRSFSELKRLVKVEDNHDFYIALSKELTDEIVNKLQNALDRMKMDGSYEKIRQSYLQ